MFRVLSQPARLAIDTGGTFTDLIFRHENGNITQLKVPSEPKSPHLAIQAAIEALQRRHPQARWDEFRHGSTVATNAILERQGATTLFVTTAGFEDLLWLRRQNRPDLYALNPRVPPPLSERCLGIQERISHRGEILQPLNDIGSWVNTHREHFDAAESIAICLLHSYCNPAHENELAAFLRRAFPSTPVTVSNELVPLFREYERATTTVVNAYVAPLMSRYLTELSGGSSDHRVMVMNSSGGVVSALQAAKEPVHTVLSGPAGGVRGAYEIARRLERDKLLTLDMGGTSTDVSVLMGRLLAEDHGAIDCHSLRIPILPIETVGAGGGSIATIDAGGALCVGPRSAGAEPGPACYGRGGRHPTVTDAHVVLERFDVLLGGDFPLDREAARAAITPLAKQLDASIESVAHSIIAVIEATIARACKRITSARGIDPRTLTLVAFGGAGGLHACALAEELGCRDVVFPRESGVLSAAGMLQAPPEQTASVSLLCLARELSTPRLREYFIDARRKFDSDDTQLRAVIDARFLGQTFTLPVMVDPDQSDIAKHVVTEFRKIHRNHFGYDLSDVAVEAVSLRLFAEVRASTEEIDIAAPTSVKRHGPESISSYGATLWIPKGWEASRWSSGDWLINRRATHANEIVKRKAADKTLNNLDLTLDIHRQRLAAVAEEMGNALMRAAFSANIKERRDFSCALFDNKGQMIAQAAHIPVHLGSQPLSVRAAIDAVQMKPGQSVILNAPFAGGTHLPDVTLVTPVFAPDGCEDSLQAKSNKKPCFFVANRAHHADVGGISPGSMPTPRAIGREAIPLTVDHEGFLIEAQTLTERLRRRFAEASRLPQDRYGDLRAQEAANHVGVQRLHELITEHGLDEMRRCHRALLDHSERQMRSILAQLPDGEWQFEDHLDDDGFGEHPLRIHLSLRIDGDSACFDFRATDHQSPGTINAVRAITLSAVFYALRCLGDDELPSNAGLMHPVTVLTQPGTLVDASPPAAVSAGNVETSQRLVDVIFGALAQAAPDRIPAASGGTMNNVVIGSVEEPEGPAFVHYETLASGAGAGPSGDGAHAIQCHMTNTLNTPIEELERLLPVRIESYALNRVPRRLGKHQGGGGIVRSYRFLGQAKVTLVTERRRFPPYGLNGAEPGTQGTNTLIRSNGRVEHLAGKISVHVHAGDTLLIKTPSGGNWNPEHASAARR